MWKQCPKYVDNGIGSSYQPSNFNFKETINNSRITIQEQHT